MRDGITGIQLYPKSSSVIVIALFGFQGGKKYHLAPAICIYEKDWQSQHVQGDQKQ